MERRREAVPGSPVNGGERNQEVGNDSDGREGEGGTIR